eukprot:CAMPEP_0170533944 /NCGR_PEP_ID=MMETSP0209-20121228/86522_1 /TAXON_ID=665100 ORGANISM="Litonotus pictus, Strain P1" /NCGR_SAMPLE_ID=MMETSP0209 /ASSEMBLY_ACC=CAM_ASM_000301 /LENGTH=125 /DNA_ID=CAMNT_0010832445 /DNA_START=82 /DNA_END=456 /DNA_ORIENTATION=-
MESQLLEYLMFFKYNIISNLESKYKVKDSGIMEQSITSIISNAEDRVLKDKKYFEISSLDDQIQFFLWNKDVKGTLIPLYLQKDYLHRSKSKIFIERLETSPLEVYLSIKTQNKSNIIKQYVTTN